MRGKRSIQGVALVAVGVAIALLAVPAAQAATVSTQVTVGYQQDAPPGENNQYGAQLTLQVDCQAEALTDPGCQRALHDHIQGLGMPVAVQCGAGCHVYVLPPYPFGGADVSLEDETTGTSERVTVECNVRALTCGPG